MIIFKSTQELQNHLDSIRTQHKVIGFVPTMGALHQGHISLIHSARQNTDIVVCSIFVNPTQFNDPKDLEKYPRTLPGDISMLEEAGCHILFAPATEEIYNARELALKASGREDDSWKEGRPVDFGSLDKVMEGAQRPGHFNGVAQVVSRLFRIVKPDKAWFGQKDFQQLAIIRSMVKQLGLPVKIYAGSIVRESDGLAMSSRNQRLSAAERIVAPQLYNALQAAGTAWKSMEPAEIKQMVEERIAATPMMKLEYFEIADQDTLLPVTRKVQGQCPVACIAVQLGQVRLIDNMVLC